MRTDARGHILEESPDVLQQGEWVRNGLVWTWIEGDELEAEPEMLNVRTMRPVDLIVCPTCQARMSEHCTTRTGKRATYPHANRLVRRSCACGGWLPPTGERLCYGCRNHPDPAVVDALVAGERIKATVAEKTEALRQWMAMGGSQREFCRIHRLREGRYAPKDEGAA